MIFYQMILQINHYRLHSEFCHYYSLLITVEKVKETTDIIHLTGVFLLTCQSVTTLSYPTDIVSSALQKCLNFFLNMIELVEFILFVFSFNLSYAVFSWSQEIFYDLCIFQFVLFNSLN